MKIKKTPFPLVLIPFILLAWAGPNAQGAIKSEDKLLNNTAGGAFLASETQAIFLPPYFSLTEWDYSPIWIEKPKASRALPKDWKTKVRFDEQYGRFRALIKAPEGTDFYGTGLVTGPLRRNNTKIALWPTSNFTFKKDNGKRLYQAHPWVMGVRKDGTAFGVIADTTWRSTIEITDHEIIFESDGDAYPVVVIEGKNPEDVLTQLAERTGKPPMPPLWSLGYQQSRYSYMTDKEGIRIASEFRKRKIPADVIWMDIDYMDQYKVFTFNPDRFPAPKEYSAGLHDLNFKGVWMVDVCMKVEDGYYAYTSGTEKNIWVKKADAKTDLVGEVWPGNCTFPDFTMAEARQWWVDMHKNFILDNGIDGIWNDVNEPTLFKTEGRTLPIDAHHRGDSEMVPGPHLKYHNIYGMLTMRASYDAIRAAVPEKRPFLLSRSNFLGGQRYGATWTGDNESTEKQMKLSVPMSITLGLSGQPFNGPDLGGFWGNASPKLWKEWVSFGVFFPFCRAHASKGTNKKEPWQFGPEVEDISRTAIERRYRLLPYLYTLFRQSSQNGLPIMNPVFFADPADLALRSEEEAFMLGKDLLIIPSFASNPSLPKGTWRQVNILENEADATKDQAIVKVRPGAIVPLGKVVQHTGEPMIDTLTLVINPDESGQAAGQLYEDAGDGYDFRQGDYCLTEFKAEKKDGQYVVSCRPTEGNRKSAIRQIRVRILTDSGEKWKEYPLKDQMVIE